MNEASLAANTQTYRDHRRYRWLLSLLVPASVGAGPLLYLGFGEPSLLWLPVILVYGAFPLLDLLLGDDVSNPPEAAVPALEQVGFYRYVTYALVPVLWLAVVFAAWFVVRHPLPWHGELAVILGTGVIGGFCINVGHELGHKRSAMERWLAKLILAPCCYGHFYVEHNRGHHRDVATPADPASARMGESIYRFLLRELPGAWRRALVLERDRLVRLGHSPWSLRNDIVQTTLITLALYGTLVAWLGWGVLPFLLLAAFWANFQLTSANYLEHYGLLRQREPSGRYESCKPKHSWNSNHVVSNWALFNLQRHSDHHAHPLRRYQSLRHFDDVPQLPSGYFGMFLLAYVPPLWFHVMDPRLIAAVHGDAGRINFDPGRRERLICRYGLSAHD